MKKLLYITLFFSLPSLLFAQTRESDSLILIQLYETLDGANWTNPENWLSSAPLDDWEGVTMQNDRVWLLKLIGQQVDGPFPDEIVGLDNLHTFEVRHGTMTGEIPAELAQITNLNRFAVGGMGLSGELPAIFDQFEFLTTLILSNNEFTGDLPAIGEKLNLFYIANNQLSGSIPASWADKNVSALQLQNNNLSGSFELFSSWEKTSSIDLSGNDWDASTFPEWITTLPLLNRFTCNFCKLYGEIPSTLDFSSAPNYDGLFVSDNELYGDISLLLPAENSEKEIYLRVRNNNFSGEFPAHKIVKAFRIDVYGNNYSSVSEFADGVSFNTFDIQFNDFTFESLEPLKEYIALDSIIFVDYDRQSALLESDTFLFIEPTTLTLESGDAHPNTTYQWFNGNTSIDGEIGPTMELDILDNSAKGSYRCKMNNSDFPDLELITNWVRVDVDFTLATDNQLDQAIDIFPNPTNDAVSVNVKEVSEKLEYRLRNSSGKMLQKGTLVNQIQIDLSEYPNGMYFLQLISGDKVGVKEIIKL